MLVGEGKVVRCECSRTWLYAWAYAAATCGSFMLTAGAPGAPGCGGGGWAAAASAAWWCMAGGGDMAVGGGGPVGMGGGGGVADAAGTP